MKIEISLKIISKPLNAPKILIVSSAINIYRKIKE